MKFDTEYMERSMRPSRWDIPADRMRLDQMICTPEQAKAKREFADKFKQFDFDWQKMPQQEKEVHEG